MMKREEKSGKAISNNLRTGDAYTNPNVAQTVESSMGDGHASNRVNRQVTRSPIYQEPHHEVTIQNRDTRINTTQCDKVQFRPVPWSTTRCE